MFLIYTMKINNNFCLKGLFGWLNVIIHVKGLIEDLHIIGVQEILYIHSDDSNMETKSTLEIW